MTRGEAFLVFWVIAFNAHAAFEERPFGARSAALGETGVAVAGGPESMNENVGAMGLADRAGGLASCLSMFDDVDLSMGAVGGIIPTERYGSWGAMATQMGDSLYREQELGLGWARRVGARAGLGLTVKWQEVAVRRYGSRDAVQADVGAFGRPRSNVAVGVTIKNLTASRGNGFEAPPSLLLAGAAINPFPWATSAVSMAQDSAGESSMRVGQEVWVGNVLALRGGFETSPQRYSLGVGFRGGDWRLDYAFVNTPLLADMHGFTLVFSP